MAAFANMSLVLFVASAAQALTIEVVPVGNPNNPPDRDHFGDGRFGAVGHLFYIGKFEVTNAQYAAFLNAVAVTTDPHELYGGHTGIVQTLIGGSFTYTLKPNKGNKPVDKVSFWDAARFANWMHNGQPTGVQDNTTTEDGAYTLGGVTNPPNSIVNRNPGATWFLPSEGEWYKAAYHQPASQGGDSGDYWLYPTATNDVPTVARSNNVGDIINPGANVVNYSSGVQWECEGENVSMTTVGSAGPASTSFYGTFDQAGNLQEWIEGIHNFRRILVSFGAECG
jgi:formylglycine-generating enzyme required for sulfatase activity